jgi:hypothetical protein
MSYTHRQKIKPRNPKTETVIAIKRVDDLGELPMLL